MGMAHFPWFSSACAHHLVCLSCTGHTLLPSNSSWQPCWGWQSERWQETRCSTCFRMWVDTLILVICNLVTAFGYRTVQNFRTITKPEHSYRAYIYKKITESSFSNLVFHRRGLIFMITEVKTRTHTTKKTSRSWANTSGKVRSPALLSTSSSTLKPSSLLWPEAM